MGWRMAEIEKARKAAMKGIRFKTLRERMAARRTTQARSRSKYLLRLEYKTYV